MSGTTPRQELIRLRLTTGLSFTEQAKVIGVSRKTLVAAEHGDPIKLQSARKIAGHYERTLSDLFADRLDCWFPGLETPCSSS